MKKVLQQGEADGLCGIYATLNFLNRTDWKDWVDHGLRALIDAARQFGWFTPQHLIDGFEDHQIKAILDLQFENYRMGYETYFLSDVVAGLKHSKFHEILERVVAKRGSVIVHWDNKHGGHWLLVTGDAGVPIVCDSDDKKRPISPLKNRRIPSSEWGIVILPCKRPVRQVNI